MPILPVCDGGEYYQMSQRFCYQSISVACATGLGRFFGTNPSIWIYWIACRDQSIYPHENRGLRSCLWNRLHKRGWWVFALTTRHWDYYKWEEGNVIFNNKRLWFIATQGDAVTANVGVTYLNRWKRPCRQLHSRKVECPKPGHRHRAVLWTSPLWWFSACSSI